MRLSIAAENNLLDFLTAECEKNLPPSRRKNLLLAGDAIVPAHGLAQPPQQSQRQNRRAERRQRAARVADDQRGHSSRRSRARARAVRAIAAVARARVAAAAAAAAHRDHRRAPRGALPTRHLRKQATEKQKHRVLNIMNAELERQIEQYLAS